MLEDFFVVPTAAQRLRSSLFGEHLDEFCSVLVDRGYAPPTVRLKLWTVAGLARWLAQRHLSITDLDERRVDEFLEVRRWRRRGARETVLCLLGQLRSAGIVPTPAPVRDDSPAAALLRSYEAYLRQERALAECTITAHALIAREFVVERLGGCTTRPDLLDAGDVRDFLLARVRCVVPTRAQYVGTALRSCASCSCVARSGRTSPWPCRGCGGGAYRTCRATSRLRTWSDCCAPAIARQHWGGGTTRSSCSSPDSACAPARFSRSSSAICAGERGRSSFAGRV